MHLGCFHTQCGWLFRPVHFVRGGFDDEEDLVAIQGPQWRNNMTNQFDGPGIFEEVMVRSKETVGEECPGTETRSTFSDGS